MSNGNVPFRDQAGIGGGSFGAPWSTLLKVMSVFSVGVLGMAAVITGVAVPRELFGGNFLTAMLVLPVIVLIGCALYTVRGYELLGDRLEIRRLLWSTAVPLAGLERAWHDPHVMDRSLRLFGNGGAFSITGLFSNRTLGRYRAWATDPKRAVVLVLPGRKLVVTPDRPEDFLRQLKLLHPHVQVGKAATRSG